MRKKVILCFMFIFIYKTVYSTANTRSSKSIIDYIKLISQKNIPLNKQGKINFILRDNSWVLQYDSIDYSSQQFIVDIVNGYVKIYHPLTGNTFDEFALFKTKKNTLIIVVNSFNFVSGPAPISLLSKIWVFKYKNNNFKNITKNAFPVVSIKDFMKKTYSMHRYNEISGIIKADLQYSLPRYGTSIKINLFLDGLKFYLEGAEDRNSKLIKEFIKNIQYRSLECKWDANKGRFYISCRIR